MKLLFSILLLIIPLCSWANNSIEQGIRFFNQKEYDQAQEIFLQESREGSAYATYWLGVVQYKNGKHFEAGETFLLAANMGSPWAMTILAGKELNLNSPCDYLGWPCDEIWADKAFEGWKIQAENGNGKAMFAMRVKKPYWWELIPFYSSYKSEEIYRDAFEKGSNRAIMRIGSWVSKEKKADYLRTAANAGYAPAMISLYFHEKKVNIKDAEKWLYKAIKLGYAQAAKILFDIYFLSGDEVDSKKKSYYYNKMYRYLGGDAQSDGYFLSEKVKENGVPVFDEQGELVTRRIISQEEQDELDRQVEEFVKDIKINLFLDETSIELF